MKLALGTVQFGLNYGIANSSGQVDIEQVQQILNVAQKSGITTLDTAIAYGSSEQCLGQVGIDSFHIISKLPPLPENIEVQTWVETQIQSSLQRLNIKQLDGLLLHRALDIVGERGVELQQALQDAVEQGLTKAVGISIYDPSELDHILAVWKPDLIQSPLNVFDQRLIQSGWLKKLADLGVRIHTRSTFLQGLLLMPLENIPEYFLPWQEQLQTWHHWCVQQNINPLQAAFAFLNQISEVESIVVGVDTASQLQQILQDSKKQIDIDWQQWAISDKTLIEPSRWKINK